MQCFQGTMKGATGWLRRVGTRRLWADESFHAKRQPRSLQTRRSQSAISCCAFSRSKKAPLLPGQGQVARIPQRPSPNRMESVSNLVVATTAGENNAPGQN